MNVKPFFSLSLSEKKKKKKKKKKKEKRKQNNNNKKNKNKTNKQIKNIDCCICDSTLRNKIKEHANMLQCRCLHILSGPRRSLATALIIPLVSARYMPLQITTGFLSFP